MTRGRIIELAAERGVRNPLCINVWTKGADGEPVAEPGRKVPVKTVRADGKPERHWRRK